MLRELGKSVLIYGIASGISKFIGLFLIPLFSRYYSPEEFGSLDLIATVISFVSILGILQLESSISRYYYEADGEKRNIYISTAFWTILIMSLFVEILVIIFSNSISDVLFQTVRFSPLIRYASINILLMNIFGYLTVILRFKSKPMLYAITIFCQFFITVLVSFVLIVYYEQGISAFFSGQIAGLAAGSLIMIIYLRKHFVVALDLQVLKDFLKYSLPQVPAVAGNWVNSYANRFIMLGQLSVHDIGIYTVALKIASVFNLLENAFRMAWEPYIWEKIKTPDHKEVLSSLSLIITAIVFSIAVLLMLFTEELFLILSTREYLAGVPIVKILFCAFSFQIIVQVFGLGTSIVKKTGYNTLGFFAGALINIGLLFILVPEIKLIGVPLCLLSGNICMFLLMWCFSEKLYPVGYPYKSVLLITVLFGLLTWILLVVEISLPFRCAILFLSLALVLIKRKELYALVLKKL